MYSATAAKCVECTDEHICVYNTAGVNLVPGRYCFGKDPAIVDLYTQFTNADRIPNYNYLWCIDCNDPNNLNSLCTFSANYFTTQAGANITCPTTRSQSHSVPIDGATYTD